LIQHVEEIVEDYYLEADGLNEKILEQFIITNSRIVRAAMMMIMMMVMM